MTSPDLGGPSLHLLLTFNLALKDDALLLITFIHMRFSKHSATLHVSSIKNKMVWR